MPYKKDRKGDPLLDTANADQVRQVLDTRVLPRGSDGFPEGGWLAPAPDMWKGWADLDNGAKDKLRQQWKVYYEADAALRVDDVGTVAGITRWWLKGDPRDTNLDALKVTLEQEQLSADLLRDGRM